VLICPHCGAENPDYSSFCSLCLARFSRVGEANNPAPHPAAAPVQQQAPPEAGDQYVSPGDYRALVQEQRQAPGPDSPPQGDYGPYAGGQGQVTGPQNTSPGNQQPEKPAYVSPGDYHALQSEIRQPQNPGLNRDSAYYQAAMQNPGSIHAAPAPAWLRKRSASEILLLILKHSFIMFILLVVVSFLLSIIIVGAAFGGSVSGMGIGLALLYGAETFILIFAGYRISSEAMEEGKGWMYGAACVAAIIFVWQPIFVFIISLFLTGRVLAPVFDPVGLMLSIFLWIPLGALGGWIAEKRYFG